MGLFFNPLIFFWCAYWFWPRKESHTHDNSAPGV